MSRLPSVRHAVRDAIAAVATAATLLGCAHYRPQSPGGEACLHRCEVAFFQCSQGGGGVWAAPVCGPAARSCLDECPDVVRLW